MSSVAFTPGEVVANRYQLISKLGEGGMGSVWRAEHVTLRSPVALKFIEASIAQNEEASARFMREAQSAAALRSTHVVQIFDYGIDRDVPYIAMELLVGDSLRERMDKVRLAPRQLADVMTQVCRAMSKAHEAGIVHRDLKPDNIFLVSEDDQEICKVLDFGIAKVSDSGVNGVSSATRTGTIMGTPYYMSPEQAQGNRTVDYRADLWALAIIVFECVTGSVPFQSDALGDLILRICIHPIPKPSEYGPVPAGFDQWFERASNRDPALRFQSAREFADSLRMVLGVSFSDVAGASSGAGPQLWGQTPFPGSQQQGLEHSQSAPGFRLTTNGHAAAALGQSSAALQQSEAPQALASRGGSAWKLWLGVAALICVSVLGLGIYAVAKPRAVAQAPATQAPEAGVQDLAAADPAVDPAPQPSAEAPAAPASSVSAEQVVTAARSAAASIAPSKPTPKFTAQKPAQGPAPTSPKPAPAATSAASKPPVPAATAAKPGAFEDRKW